METVDIFYGHLEYLTAIWDIKWPFGTFLEILVYFSRFSMLYQEKSGNPGYKCCRSSSEFGNLKRDALRNRISFHNITKYGDWLCRGK
jgi:hypothetical protein